MNKGMERRSAWKCAALAVSVCAMLGLGGCEQKPLVTGTLDPTKLLEYDEEYQHLSSEYLKARMELTADLQKTLEKSGGVIKDQATYDKFALAEKKLDEEWGKITSDFTDQKMGEIRQACDKLHQSKGIDLVLLDTSYHPTVEYGSTDITSDVLVELSGFAGSDTITNDGQDKAKSAPAADNATPATGASAAPATGDAAPATGDAAPAAGAK